MNPSTEELLTAVESVSSDDVILMPNNKNIILAAQQAKELSDKNVEVVPTITVPQGIAALLALNYQADLETNARIMKEASEHIETIEITTAVRSAQVNGMSVEQGEVIALINGELKLKGAAANEVATGALREVQAEDYEIITMYYGEVMTGDQAEQLAGEIAERYPDQEIEVIDGGQPHYNYIISVE
jgi:hypothetical protein